MIFALLGRVRNAIAKRQLARLRTVEISPSAEVDSARTGAEAFLRVARP